MYMRMNEMQLLVRYYNVKDKFGGENFGELNFCATHYLKETL